MTAVRVTVPLGERSYDVLVGHGVVHDVAALVPATARRVAVVTQRSNPMASAVEFGRPHETFLIPDGEPAKTLATVETLCRGFVAMGLTRNDCVVGVGGGLVTDVAGFAAAVYHRGVAVVHVPTTLLAMVDAAIGGKTGVNLPEGKNLVGAFWQPNGVVCDLDALTTLPEREMRPSTTSSPVTICSPCPWPSESPAVSPSRPRWWRATSVRAAEGRS
jgi:5-deoxy-5-amino-3-dehydroquinate synthase